MASLQVKRLCKKILEQTGIYCKPETFCPNKDRSAVEFGEYAWCMDIDIEKSPKLAHKLERSDYIGDIYREDTFVCVGTDYMKECLNTQNSLLASGNISLNPHYPEREIKIYTKRNTAKAQ